MIDLQEILEKIKPYVLGWVHPFHPLSSPLVSSAWNGSSGFSTTAKTRIDLSAVFGIPAGVKAVLLYAAVRDAGSAGGQYYFIASPINTAYYGPFYALPSRAANDEWNWVSGIVPCDGNGDLYYQIAASGANTMDVQLQIWGYWL